MSEIVTHSPRHAEERATGWVRLDVETSPRTIHAEVADLGTGLPTVTVPEKLTPERHLMVEAHLLRKPGQSDIDPMTGESRPGAFESWTRFEIFDPSYRKD